MKIRTMVSLLGLYMFFATASFAQVGKGSFLIDGGISSQLEFVEPPSFLFSDGKIEIHSNRINPSIAYFVSDRLAVGGSLMVQNTNAYEGISSFGIGTRIRYYFSKRETNAWFLENKIDYHTADNISILNGQVGLGWNYFISDNFAFEGAFAFQKSKNKIAKYGQPSSRWNTGFNAGLKFFLNSSTDSRNATYTSILQKGTLLLGTSSGGFNYRVINDYKVLTIHLNPNIGQFISKNWLIGAGLDLNYRKIAYGSYYGDRKDLTVSLSPFIRYYAPTKNGKFAPFFEVGSAFSRPFHFEDSEDGSLPDPYPNPKIDIGFLGGVGMNLFVSPTTALELKVGYDTTDFKSHRIGLDIGFQYFLGRLSTK